MIKALILGGSGFLGSHVADALYKKNFKIVIFDKKKPKWLNKKYNFIRGELKDKKKLSEAIKDSSIVYHFAAMGDIGECMSKPIESANINIIGTLNVLNLCIKFNVKRIIFASTIYVHSDQGSFYKITKQTGESYIEEYHKRFGLNYTILRYGTIYGPRSNIKNNLSKIVNNALKLNLLAYSGKSGAIRRYLHVNDAANASVSILKNRYKNKNVLITGKNKIKIKDIMKIISKKLNITSKVKYGNTTQLGHYNINPYTYKKKKEQKFIPKDPIDIKKGIEMLIDHLK